MSKACNIEVTLLKELYIVDVFEGNSDIIAHSIMFTQGSEKKNFSTEEGKYKVLYTWESRLRNIDSRTHWMRSLF